MISDEQIVLAKRYALALLHVSGDQLSYDDCIALNKAALLLRQHHNWLVFFETPDMTDKQREHMVIMLQERLHVPFACERMVHLLLMHRRMRLLPDVFECVAQLYFMMHKVELFTISSALEMTAVQIETIRAFLAHMTGKKIMYTYRVEASLIAGVRAQSHTALWEYSLTKKIRDAYRLVGG